MISISPIYPQFKNLSGQPLENGYVWIGEVDQNPETAPVSVFWDEAGTQPAAQPLRTLNGFVYRSGTPASIFTAGNYSQTVRTLQGALVSYCPDAFEALNGGDELVSITRYGASPLANAAANAVAIQAALDNNQSVYVPDLTFNVGDLLSFNYDNSKLWGPGTLQFSAALDGGDACLQAISKTGITIDGPTILGTQGFLPTSLVQLKACTYGVVRNCSVRWALHEGISLNQSTYDCEVAGNLVRDIRGGSPDIGWGIGLFWDIQRCDVHDNRIIDCGAYGIVMDDGTSAQVGSLPCIGNDIHDNLIHTTTTLMWGIAIEGSKDNNVHDNYIQIIGTYGIDIHAGNSSTVFYPIRNLVHHNIIHCDTAYVNNGIRMAGGSFNQVYNNEILAGDIGISVTNVDTTNMVGNIIKDNRLAGFANAGATNKTAIQLATAFNAQMSVESNAISSAGTYGIQAQAGAGLRIVNNKISNTGKEGINATGIFSGLVIQGNLVDGASGSSSNTYAGVYVESTGASTSGLVANNEVTDTQSVPTCIVGTQIAGSGNVYSVLQVFGNISLKPGVIIPLAYSNPTTIYGAVIPQFFTGGSVAPTYVEDMNVWVITATSDVSVASPTVGFREGNQIEIAVIQDGTGGWNVTFDSGYVTAWSNTGNTANKQSTLTFVAQQGLLVQQGAQSPYM